MRLSRPCGADVPAVIVALGRKFAEMRNAEAFGNSELQA